MQLRRENAAEEQREEERHGRGDRAALPRDEAGAEEDDAGDPEEDRGRHRQGLGERPPEGEPDGASGDRREKPRPAHRRRRTTRVRSAPPPNPASPPRNA